VFVFARATAKLAFTMPKKSTKSRQAVRAKGMTQISLSLPADLVARIDKIADSENRNRSNFIAVVMKQLAESR
jgi:hypothetical protein